MFSGKTVKSPGDFWQEYEEKTGEKVLAKGLGQYLSGWKEFDEWKVPAMWGLVIATSGGFRFHHFPQQNWIAAITAGFGGNETAKEKTIFIPKEKIVSTQLVKKQKLWEKLFKPVQLQFSIVYRDEMENEHRLFFKIDTNSAEITEKLNCFREGLTASNWKWGSEKNLPH